MAVLPDVFTMLPARFTTEVAAVAFIAFAVADDITDPDTFMNTTFAPADIAFAAPCATTEPVTMTGAVVMMPSVAEPVTLPVTKVGAVVVIAEASVPPNIFPFIKRAVPTNLTPLLLTSPTPPSTLPVIVKIPADWFIPILLVPPLLPPVTLPITTVFPFVDTKH